MDVKIISKFLPICLLSVKGELMWRIICVVVFSALVLFGKVFTPVFSWALIAVGELVIMLTMIPKPITQFIHPPPMSSLELELTMKIRMIQAARESGADSVQVFVAGSGWIDGKVLDLSKVEGVLLLKVNDGLGAETILVKDIVRVRISSTSLNYLLKSSKGEQNRDADQGITTAVSDAIL